MAKLNGSQLSASRLNAFEKLGIAPSKRLILCLDGGGMRGILTVQLLKKLEEIAGIPCYELFDMVSGTSTGAIIAGLIASGHTAIEIEMLYKNLVTKVFHHNFLGQRFINPPAFNKDNYRELLKQEIGNITLANACQATDIDLMITSQDIAAAEETFFSCFKQDENIFHGTYKDVLLRAVMEATMSAPTYFNPLERFVDGGTTTYNNPSLAAIMEAISYSRADKNLKKSAYKPSNLVVFSFGTGITRQFIDPNYTINPTGIDSIFWLNWLMTATGQDASAMQVNTLRTPVFGKQIDYRRFQISLDTKAIRKLPNIDKLDEEKYGSKWLHDITDKQLDDIDMADVTKFDLMEVIGEQMAEYIIKKNGFKKDLVDDRNNDLLITTFGDIDRIKIQMSDPTWLDEFKS